MNDLEGIITTVAKILSSHELTEDLERDELLVLAITIAEKLVQAGYSKGLKEYVDIFDEEWQEKIYALSFGVPPEKKSETVPVENLTESEPVTELLHWIDEEPGDYSLGPYDDEELELYSNDEPIDEEYLLEAPPEPKIKYPERAGRKKLNPILAEANAPRWANITPN